MSKGRLEAFSDGVHRHPHHHHGAGAATSRRTPTLEALQPLAPVFISYVLSFVYLGIYWNNHHHLLQSARWSTAAPCGRTCTCCSGCRWSRSRRVDGPDDLRPCRPRCTAWCCWRPPSPTPCSSRPSASARPVAVDQRGQRRRPQGRGVAPDLCAGDPGRVGRRRSSRSGCTPSWRSSGSCPIGAWSVPSAPEGGRLRFGSTRSPVETSLAPTGLVVSRV